MLKQGTKGRLDILKDNTVIIELEKYVKNQKQVIEQLKFMVDKHALKEEYEQAGDYNRQVKIQEMNVYRLERVLQGLPAFPTSPTNIIVNDQEKENT